MYRSPTSWDRWARDTPRSDKEDEINSATAAASVQPRDLFLSENQNHPDVGRGKKSLDQTTNSMSSVHPSAPIEGGSAPVIGTHVASNTVKASVHPGAPVNDGNEINNNNNTVQHPSSLMKEEVNDDGTMNVDPAEKIYDTAKGIWGWGKSVVFFSPFLGVAEGIAGKVVQRAGSSMEDVDHALTGHLQALDDGILNPAVTVVVKTLLGAASRTEAFLKPIIIVILKPIDFMIKSKAEEGTPRGSGPELTPVME